MVATPPLDIFASRILCFLNLKFITDNDNVHYCGSCFIKVLYYKSYEEVIKTRVMPKIMVIVTKTNCFVTVKFILINFPKISFLALEFDMKIVFFLNYF